MYTCVILIFTAVKTIDQTLSFTFVFFLNYCKEQYENDIKNVIVLSQILQDTKSALRSTDLIREEDVERIQVVR